jgi:peptide-methionine (S)-S-oxide reductase
MPSFHRTLSALLLALAACSGPAAPVLNQPAPAPTPAASAPATAPTPTTAPGLPTTMPNPSPGAPATTELATLANGCFWCTEAVLERLDGVLDVTSGYMGGQVDDPTYEQVCSGTTGHAECVQVRFDPARIGYDALLEWFFKSHDPTTLNRQGADIGTQYRSAIFFHSPAQEQAARAAIQKAQPQFGAKIVTEVTAASRFYSAEGYHQDYFRRNPNQGYCRMVIAPKMQKLFDKAK